MHQRLRAVHQESLPWKLTYHGFTGILPAIRSVRFFLTGGAFRIAQTVLFTFTCESTSEEAHPDEGEAIIEAGGNTTNFLPDPNITFPATGANCPETEGSFTAPTGDGQITILGATTRIRLTLI